MRAVPVRDSSGSSRVEIRRAPRRRLARRARDRTRVARGITVAVARLGAVSNLRLVAASAVVHPIELSVPRARVGEERLQLLEEAHVLGHVRGEDERRDELAEPAFVRLLQKLHDPAVLVLEQLEHQAEVELLQDALAVLLVQRVLAVFQKRVVQAEMTGVVPQRAEVQREHLHRVEHAGGEALVQAVRRREHILRGRTMFFVMEASVRDAESVESVESVAATRIAASQSGDVRFSAPRGRGSAGRRSAGFGGRGTKTHRRVQRAVIRVLHRVQQLQAFQQRLEPFLGDVERLHESLPREDVERDVPQRHAPGLRHREHVVLPRLGPGPVRGRHRAPAVQRSIPRADAAPWRMHVARGPRASSRASGDSA